MNPNTKTGKLNIPIRLKVKGIKSYKILSVLSFPLFIGNESLMDGVMLELTPPVHFDNSLME